MIKLCLGCMASYDDDYNICPDCGYAEGTPVVDAMHMEPGSKLQDRYIVGKALGNGGFGVTYAAWDKLMERPVAIKEYLPSEFSTRTPGQTKITVYSGDKSEQFVDGLSKFIDEARRLAKLTNTEGIVNILDSFEENNTAYIVMELLKGETLSERLKREGSIPADEALTILTPIIRSLETVHKKGIIHRDIAPDNIFLMSDGGAKLIDFGAARFATTTHSRSLTVIIKQGYSPEEQYRSKADQGGYTDVYSIAATLYRMITGHTPPDALERRASLEHKHKDILLSPSKHGKLAANIETAILNALNIRIEDRTPDISTFLFELTTDKTVKRRYDKIKKIDLLSWPIWAKIGVPTALLIVTALLTLFATGFIGFKSPLDSGINIPEGMSRVPSVINDNLDNAEKRLNDVKLTYSITGKEYSSEILVNYILNQDIPGGTIVEFNTVINITVSGGGETQAMPGVEGLSVDKAKKILEDLGFIVRIVEEYSPIEKDAVVLQDIQSGVEFEIGGAVTLIVSAGPDPSTADGIPVNMPDFVNMAFTDALKEAASLGLTLTVNREYSLTVEKDIVISQNIAKDSEIISGSKVEITVSLGVETVYIKDVQYRTADEAKSILEGQGLKVTYLYENSDTVASGVVIRQTPTANTAVMPGTNVSIVVSSGTQTSSGIQQPAQATPPTATSTPLQASAADVTFKNLQTGWKDPNPESAYSGFYISYRVESSAALSSSGVECRSSYDQIIRSNNGLGTVDGYYKWEEGTEYFDPSVFVYGQTYFWTAYVIVDNKRYDSPTQSFVFPTAGSSYWSALLKKPEVSVRIYSYPKQVADLLKEVIITDENEIQNARNIIDNLVIPPDLVYPAIRDNVIIDFGDGEKVYIEPGYHEYKGELYEHRGEIYCYIRYSSEHGELALISPELREWINNKLQIDCTISLNQQIDDYH